MGYLKEISGSLRFTHKQDLNLEEKTKLKGFLSGKKGICSCLGVSEILVYIFIGLKKN